MGSGGERRGGIPAWADVVAALAAAVGDGWRAGATALWAAGRRREAAWLRADHRAAAIVVRGATSGRPRDVLRAVRRCRAMARRSAAHATLAAPWRDAARWLAVAAGVDAGRRTDLGAAPPFASRHSRHAPGTSAGTGDVRPHVPGCRSPNVDRPTPAA